MKLGTLIKNGRAKLNQGTAAVGRKLEETARRMGQHAVFKKHRTPLDAVPQAIYDSGKLLQTLSQPVNIWTPKNKQTDSTPADTSKTQKQETVDDGKSTLEPLTLWEQSGIPLAVARFDYLNDLRTAPPSNETLK